MAFNEWQPMSTAPRDGRDIVVKSPRHEIFVRVAWDGGRWVSGGTPIVPRFAGWRPLPGGPGCAGVAAA